MSFFCYGFGVLGKKTLANLLRIPESLSNARARFEVIVCSKILQSFNKLEHQRTQAIYRYSSTSRGFPWSRSHALKRVANYAYGKKVAKHRLQIGLFLRVVVTSLLMPEYKVLFFDCYSYHC